MSQIPLIYVLYSGKLYGTECMTIRLVKGMLDRYLSVILTPPGLILEETAQHNINTMCFYNNWDFIHCLKYYLIQHLRLIFVTTSVSQSILIVLCNLFYRRQIIHLHIVQGGTEEHLSYGRKSLLNNLPLKFIAVSNYVRQRLEAHRVYSHKIQVVKNFLLESKIENTPKRQPFKKPGITNIVIVYCLDPIKRIDLLFDALDSLPKLNNLELNIFSLGKNFDQFKTKIVEKYPQITLGGFCDQIWQIMSSCDLLLSSVIRF